mmetsp:Transcript_52530/g.168431  ORF Transcript_52530/g.168431 Transcript_52530/m.168431 type:complete len:235 (-) Transcript_52530:90-794(-)
MGLRSPCSVARPRRAVPNATCPQSFPRVSVWLLALVQIAQPWPTAAVGGNSNASSSPVEVHGAKSVSVGVGEGAEFHRHAAGSRRPPQASGLLEREHIEPPKSGSTLGESIQELIQKRNAFQEEMAQLDVEMRQHSAERDALQRELEAETAEVIRLTKEMLREQQKVKVARTAIARITAAYKDTLKETKDALVDLGDVPKDVEVPNEVLQQRVTLSAQVYVTAEGRNATGQQEK